MHLGDLTPVLILGVIFWGILAIVREVAQNRLRHRILEKGLTGVNVQNLFQRETAFGSQGSLKWGILLLGVGLVLLVSQLIPLEFSDETTFGVMFITAGICLLVYYFVVPKIGEKPEEKKTGR
jgi:phosphatidylglycerophosphate synthase